MCRFLIGRLLLVQSRIVIQVYVYNGHTHGACHLDTEANESTFDREMSGEERVECECKVIMLHGNLF